MKSHFEDVFIEITNHCNFNCLYCPQDKMTREKGFMDSSKVKELLTALVENNITSKVHFHVMGEPLLHPQLIELCEYAKKLGLSVALATNGSLLSKDKARALFETGIDRLAISVDACSERAFEVLKRTPLNFEKYLDRIRSTVELKFETQARTTIAIYNYMHMPHASLLGYDKSFDVNRLQDLSRSLKDWFSFAAQVSHRFGLSAIPHNVKDVKPRFRYELLPGVIVQNGVLHGWGAGTQRLPALIGACFGLQKQFAILWNGDFVMCCADYNGETVLGNVNERDIRDIMGSREFKRARQMLRFCMLPTPFCRRCRGGPTIRSWFVNQLASIVWHRLHLLR